MDVDTKYDIEGDIPTEVSARAVELLANWRLPKGKGPIGLRRLVGGANNINLVVMRDGTCYVLKMRSTHGAKLTTGLNDAVRGQQLAAQAGMAPRILASTLDGDFLSEFVIGTTLRPEVFRSTDCLPAVVHALKAVHALPPTERRFDIFGDVSVFAAEAIELGAKLPDYFVSLREVADRFHGSLEASGAPVSFLHGDLVPQNMILTENGIKFVDFDYCGLGMTAADLAIAASQAELDADETERFLRLYDPNLDDGQRARILGIQFVNTLREISWACAAERKVAETTTLFGDWSYEYHARINRELAERILAAHSISSLEREMAMVRVGAKF